MADRTEPKAGEGDTMAERTEPKAGEGDTMAERTETKAGEGEAATERTEIIAGDGGATVQRDETKASEGEAAAGRTETKAGGGEATTERTETKAGEGEETTERTLTNAGDGGATIQRKETKAGEGEAMAGRTETKAGEGEATTERTETKAGEGEETTERTETSAGDGGATIQRKETKAGEGEATAGRTETKAGGGEMNFDGFLGAMKEDGACSDSGLEKAFQALSQGGTTGPVTKDVLRQAMEHQGVKLTADEVTGIVVKVKSGWNDGEHITCQQLKDIVNVATCSWALKAMKGKTDLKEDDFVKSNCVKTVNIVDPDLLRRGLEIHGVELSTEEVGRIIGMVKANWKDPDHISYQEFKDLACLATCVWAMKAVKEGVDLEEEAFAKPNSGTTRNIVAPNLFRMALEMHGVELSPEEVESSIRLVKGDWKDDADHISYREFNNLARVATYVWAVKAIKEGTDLEGKAFFAKPAAYNDDDDRRTSGDNIVVPNLLLGGVLGIHEIHLTQEDVGKIIGKVKADWKYEHHISFQEFKDLIYVAKYVGALKEQQVPSTTTTTSSWEDNKGFKALMRKGESGSPVTGNVLSWAMYIVDENVRLTAGEVEGILFQTNPNWKHGVTPREFQTIKEKMEQRSKTSIKDQLKEICKTLEDKMKREEDKVEGDEQKNGVVVYGEAGVGKSWMAKKVVDRVVRRSQIDDDHDYKGKNKWLPIWIYPKRSYKEGLTLADSIAHQLFLMLPFHKSEAELAAKRARDRLVREARNGGPHNDSNHNKDGDEEKHKQERLWKKILDEIKNKMLLLVYDDDDDDHQAEGPSRRSPELIKFENDLESLKGVVTTCKLITTRSKNLFSSYDKSVEVTQWTWKEAHASFKNRILVDDDESKELADFFIRRTKKLPAEILIIATTMSYLLQDDRESGMHKLQTIRNKMRRSEKGGVAKVFPMLISECGRIPKSILIDSYSVKTPATHFLRRGREHRGMVHYNELISYWIIEGYLGRFESFQQQYDRGYRVLTHLLDCGLLRKLEDSYVMSSSSDEMVFDFDSLEYNEFYKNVVLGLGNTFDCKFGRMALADGVMRTIAGRQAEDKMRGDDKKQGEDKLRDAELLEEGTKMVTIMLDGNHFEIPDNASLFGSTATDLSKKGFLPLQLENLAVFYPTFKPFPLPVSKLKGLRFLVLRECRYLEDFGRVFTNGKDKVAQDKNDEKALPSYVDQDQKSKPNDDGRVLRRSNTVPAPITSSSRDLLSHTCGFFSELQVLEISGPSPVHDLSECIFESARDKLKSVNLSGLAMKRLPSSFYTLTSVEYLILRGCPELVLLESLEKFVKLKLLDASGSTKLSRFAQKNFKPNKLLQFVNFSGTNLDRIPLIRDLEHLEYLILSDCRDLRGIRKVDQQNELRVLDIAGAVRVEEFIDPIIKNLNKIDLLDVSRTAMRRLPGRAGRPRILNMKDCPKLKELLPIEDMQRLEVLDVSGSKKLVIIHKDFMSSMECLRELNLSKTGITALPPLVYPRSLRRLFVNDCTLLKKLNGLSDMEELEELEICGCNALEEMKDPPLSQSLDKLGQLHKLFMCRLQIKYLPLFSGLKRLKILHVEDCPNVDNLRGVEKIPALEMLNHSATYLKSQIKFDSRTESYFIESKSQKQLNQSVNGTTVVGPIAPDWEKLDTHNLLKDLGAKVDGAGEIDPPKEDLPCNWNIRRWMVEGNSEEVPIQKCYVGGKVFLHLLEKKCPTLVTDCFTGCNISLEPPEYVRVFIESGAGSVQCPPLPDQCPPLPDRSSYKDELNLRSLRWQQVFETDAMLKSCLEIRGFKNSLIGAKPLLQEANSIVCIDNPFFKCLCNLGLDGDKAMKVCWIERCNEMEYLIEPLRCAGDHGSVADCFQNLGIVWFSHAMKLKKISDGSPGFSFRKLTTLCLEFCPELTSISSFDVLKALKTLYIRNCKNLKTLSSEDKQPAEVESLTELNLWGLPMLEEIDLKAKSLNKIRVGDCCKLKYVLPSIQGGYVELKNLRIKLCENLNRICQSSNEDLSTCSRNLEALELWALPKLRRVSGYLPELQSLKVGECHSLVNLMESDNFPSKLTNLEVKSCKKLEMIVQSDEGGEVDDEGVRRELSGIKRWEPKRINELELICLPELESLDAKYLPMISLPELESLDDGNNLPTQQHPKCMIWGCPKLEKNLALLNCYGVMNQMMGGNQSMMLNQAQRSN